MGCNRFLLDTVKRFTRLFPRSVVANWELFLVGSVRPCSRCRMRTAFKQAGMVVAESYLARKAA